MRRFALRLLALVRSGKAEADLKREIDAHLQLLEDRFVSQGMTARDARDAARRAFGGQVEQTRLRQRDARSFRWLDETWLDVKLGARMLVKYPGLTIVGGVGMAAAIAISAASFAFFYAYMSSTLPLDEGDRIVALENWDIEANNEERQALHDYEQWSRELRSFEAIAAFRTVSRNLIIPGGPIEPVRLAEMTASGFRIARVAPILGRPILAEDEHPGAAPVVVIGADVWRSRFASDAAVVGRHVQLGNVTHTIVGVMPDGFAFPVSHSYWVPLDTDASEFARGEGPTIFIFGRLARGVTVEQANGELTAIGQRASAAFPRTHGRLRPRVMAYALPILDIQDVSMWQVTLMQLTLSTLLIVVAVNVAILIYARTATRQGEIAVRTALGASRPRIIGQLFIEALVLAVCAAALGLAIARFGLDQAHRLMQMGTARPPYWIDYGIPWIAVLYVIGLSLFAAAVAGALPAWRATSPRVQATLRELSGSSGMRLGRTWTALIVVQVAFAVAALPMVVATGWSEMRSTITKPAFAPEPYLAGSFAMDPEPPAGTSIAVYRREMNDRFATLRQELVRRVEAEAQVADLTLAMRPPGQESPSRVEIAREPEAAAEGTVRINHVDVDFFDAFDARLVAGRTFTTADRDAAAGAGSIGSSVIVNRAFVRQLLAGTSPLGLRVREVARDDDDDGRVEASPWHEIVGVVDDLQVNAIDPDLVKAALYYPLAAGGTSSGTVIVRMSDDAPAAFVNRLRAIAAAVDPTLRVTAYPLVEIEREANLGFRLMAIALSLVIVAVLLLSAAGIYALMSFTVSQRRKEIGIRVALGANARTLLASIFARAGAQLALGVAFGLAIAVSADHLSGDTLFGKEGVVLLPAMSVVMVIVGLLAAVGPARRGLRVQPTQALRDE